MAAENIYTLSTEGEIKARAQERKHRMDYQRLRKVDRIERELEAVRSRAQGISYRVQSEGPRKVERLERELEAAKSRAGVTIERLKAA